MNDETRYAVGNSPSHGPIVGRGPTFAGGSGHDMLVNGSTVYINPGHSFTAGCRPLTCGDYDIKQMEDFLVARSSLAVGEQDFTRVGKPVTRRYTDEINRAMNVRRKRVCLM